MTAKKSTMGSRGKARKLKLKKESIKDLTVRRGAGVKGGLALASPSMAVVVTGCGGTAQCATMCTCAIRRIP